MWQKEPVFGEDAKRPYLTTQQKCLYSACSASVREAGLCPAGDFRLRLRGGLHRGQTQVLGFCDDPEGEERGRKASSSGGGTWGHGEKSHIRNPPVWGGAVRTAEKLRVAAVVHVSCCWRHAKDLNSFEMTFGLPGWVPSVLALA